MKLSIAVAPAPRDTEEGSGVLAFGDHRALGAERGCWADLSS